MALFAERHQDYLRKYTELRNEKVKNRPIPYLHGVRKMDSACAWTAWRMAGNCTRAWWKSLINKHGHTRLRHMDNRRQPPHTRRQKHRQRPDNRFLRHPCRCQTVGRYHGTANGRDGPRVYKRKMPIARQANNSWQNCNAYVCRDIPNPTDCNMPLSQMRY